ncbi:MAG: radical SAM protein [Rhodospirillales bacterium]|jgi:tRNA A37 methylthiotransferase MiaB|nr:radical SAM protein [Rhodospirillales bacterium]
MGAPVFPDYDLPLYRPPSEARSLIIQATIGCSFNRCTFCSMYKGKAFRPRPLEAVYADIAVAARMRPETQRVFLADGDALCLPTEHLTAILDRLAAVLPRLRRVSLYATPSDLTRKSRADLRRLRDKGLTLAYLGMESGSAAVLARVRKGASARTIESGIARARAAGLAISATVILGLGGRTLWREHIDETARLINRAPPDYLSTLQLRLEDDSAAEFIARFQRDGEVFLWQDDAGILAEQERLIETLDPGEPVVFRSNHASNCLPLAGTLPEHRDRLLALVALARTGAPMLRPEPLRGL